MTRKFLLAPLALSLLNVGAALADVAPKETFQEKIPVKEPEVQKQAQPECGWTARLSAGVPVWFFDKEDAQAAAGLYIDAAPCDLPLKLRVGVEGRHIDIDQDGAENYAEAPGKATKITFIRIPFAAEYVYQIDQGWNWYTGGGPDLIRTANDLSDFTVGLHLSTRLEYEFENQIAVALEGGYMWSEVERHDKGDISLDGAYVLPTIGYRF